MNGNARMEFQVRQSPGWFANGSPEHNDER